MQSRCRMQDDSHSTNKMWVKNITSCRKILIDRLNREEERKILAHLVSLVSSVLQSCLTLCNPMNYSRPRFPVHHQLLEFTQTHAHWVDDAIQPSHALPLSSFSSCLQSFPASGSFHTSQVFHQVAKVLEFQLQHQSLQWIFRTDFLLDGVVGSPCSPRDSQDSSSAPQFKSINYLVLSFLYSRTLTIYDYRHVWLWTP